MFLSSYLSALVPIVFICVACTNYQLVLAISPPFHVLSVQAELYILPILNYDFDQLEPYMTREMIVAHYEGHHETYRRKMNAALNAWREDEPLNQLTTQPLAKILMNLDSISEKFRTTLRNNIGGYANHALYWAVMSPPLANGTERVPSDRILEDIEASFGSYAAFKAEFSHAANEFFGSGYVWLVRDRDAPADKQLSIITTVNQDSPLSQNLHPILVIDLWEHAYYLKYQFRRADFVANWWKLVDWENVGKLDRFWKKVIDMEFDGHTEL